VPVYTDTQREAAAKLYNCPVEDLKQVDLDNFAAHAKAFAVSQEKPVEGVTKAEFDAMVEALKVENAQNKVDMERKIAEYQKPPGVDPDESRAAMSRISRIKSVPELQRAVEEPAQDADIAALHVVHDDLVTLRGMQMRKNAKAGIVRDVKVTDLNYFQHVKERSPELANAYQKALDTQTSDGGSDWVPTLYSATRVDSVFDGLTVTPLFRRINMGGQQTVQYPRALTGGTAYLAGESIDDATAVNYDTSTPATGYLSMTSKKLAISVPWADEWSEGSIIQPVLPEIRSCVTRSIGEAIEEAVLNGDTTATHMDSALVTASNDRRRAWNGLRHRALVTDTTAAKSLATFTGDTLLSIFTAMTQKYLSNLADILIIIPNALRAKMYTLVDNSTNKIPVFLRSTALGDNTVLTGQIGDFYGSPVIQSGWIPITLGTNGLCSAASTYTALIVTDRKAWVLADARELRLEMDREVRQDLNYMVATWRGIFSYVPPTADTATGCGYYITP